MKGKAVTRALWFRPILRRRYAHRSGGIVTCMVSGSVAGSGDRGIHLAAVRARRIHKELGGSTQGQPHARPFAI